MEVCYVSVSIRVYPCSCYYHGWRFPQCAHVFVLIAGLTDLLISICTCICILTCPICYSFSQCSHACTCMYWCPLYSSRMYTYIWGVLDSICIPACPLSGIWFCIYIYLYVFEYQHAPCHGLWCYTYICPRIYNSTHWCSVSLICLCLSDRPLFPYVFVHISICISVYTDIPLSPYICVHVCIYISVPTYIPLLPRIHALVCIYIHICISIDTSLIQWGHIYIYIIIPYCSDLFCLWFYLCYAYSNVFWSLRF